MATLHRMNLVRVSDCSLSFKIVTILNREVSLTETHTRHEISAGLAMTDVFHVASGV